jgi:hypothetical protein
VDGLTSTEGLVALGAAAVALIALVLAAVLAVQLRRLRASQRAVLGDAGERDLVQHASRLERGFVELRDWVEDTAAGIERRMGAAEQRIDGCVAHRSLVRYDAYGELSGHQSSSLALLDARRSGVVVSSIHHRDSARVYVKQVVAGEAELELSPEEQEAVDTALRTGVGATAGE